VHDLTSKMQTLTQSNLDDQNKICIIPLHALKFLKAFASFLSAKEHHISSLLAVQVPWAIAHVIYTMAPSLIVLYGLLSCPLTLKSCCNDISNIMCMRKDNYYINGQLQTLRT